MVGNRWKRLLACLALDRIASQPPQRCRRVNVLAMRTGPGRCRRELLIARSWHGDSDGGVLQSLMALGVTSDHPPQLICRITHENRASATIATTASA